MTETAYLVWFEDDDPGHGGEILALGPGLAAEAYARLFADCFSLEDPEAAIVVMGPDGKSVVVDVEMVVDFEGYVRR